jgi:hypothetical protein
MAIHGGLYRRLHSSFCLHHVNRAFDTVTVLVPRHRALRRVDYGEGFTEESTLKAGGRVDAINFYDASGRGAEAK